MKLGILCSQSGGGKWRPILSFDSRPTESQLDRLKSKNWVESVQVANGRLEIVVLIAQLPAAMRAVHGKVFCDMLSRIMAD